MQKFTGQPVEFEMVVVSCVMSRDDIHMHTDLAYASGQVRRITWIGLVINVVLSALKLAGGVIGRSQVVVADAVHTLSDSTTDVTILVGVRFWSKPPDALHPHGHRRIETVITVAIGAALVVVAAALAYNGLVALRQPRETIPGWIAFVAAALSVVIKEGLYRWTASVGRRIKSSSVVANAWHHRSDALSSIPAALAVAVAAVYPPWAFVDNVGAIVVSLFILQAAWRIVLPSLGQLIDAGAGPEVLERIKAIALDTEGVDYVHAIRTRFVGSALQVDLHIKVDGRMTVQKGHDISEVVKRRLIEQGPDVVDVVVHLEPANSPIPGEASPRKHPAAEANR